MMRAVASAVAMAAVLLAGATSSTPLEAPPMPAVVDEPCQPTHVPFLGQACRRPDGLFDVVLADGTRVQTHGPDPLPAAEEVGWDPGAEERPLVCADDWRMQVLYGHPSGSPDRTGSVLEDIRSALRRMNAVLNADALESGGVTADYRVACDASGDILIDTFSTAYTSSPNYVEDFDTVVNAARADGHDRQRTDYLVFWDGDSTVCGAGTLHADDSASADNANLPEADYGVVFSSCWFGRTPMHENGHNQGAVQDLAPMWDGTGHCLEGYDVMCYPGEAGVTLGLLLQCSDRVHYDCNHDTYFDAGPEAGEWLATHWNIGSPLNRYIAFDHMPSLAGTTEDPAENETSQDANSDGNATGPRPSSSSGRTASKSATSSRAPVRTVAAAPPPAGNATRPALGPVEVSIPTSSLLVVVALTAALAVASRPRR